MPPSEALVAIDMHDSHEVEVVDPGAAPLPKSKKRKSIAPETDTPRGAADRFEDARETPFTLRKKRQDGEMSPATPVGKRQEVFADLRKSKLSSAATHREVESDDAFETADEHAASDDIHEADQEGTASATISPELDSAHAIEAIPSLSVSGESDDSDDEDDAPEAVSNKVQADQVKAHEDAVATTLKRKEDEAKRKRQARNAALKKQKDQSKASKRPSAPSLPQASIEGLEEEDSATQATPKKQAIPRFLPDEILNAAPIAVQPPSEQVTSMQKEHRSQSQAVHKRFDREVTQVKRGNVLVKKLAKQRTDLAPKRNATTANTKHQWLYARNADAKGRRPLKKPLM
ncbi:hypothetical protein BCR37DRAFT_391679 [Protomyces lactucae-debilis]|uniref:U3 snoRNA associated-domain-containing protein n=1 Tax=Protomyces lactucae-debilis TaxID=2754530 RepID=A0A1Y2FLU9_PROLT|nr:uncharacterized protein BCR37DRAFT_391679 [Protomyces lactucae-debilis]ORY84962.1 hypothetical protein BCR37DRAFT_391679 [Protomyces lactucae-debilis]